MKKTMKIYVISVHKIKKTNLNYPNVFVLFLHFDIFLDFRLFSFFLIFQCFSTLTTPLYPILQGNLPPVKNKLAENLSPLPHSILERCLMTPLGM